MGREENTKIKLINPKLKDSGWFDHEWQIDMEYAITAGKIQWDGKSSRRSKPLYADYLLRYKPSMAIAVVEAKADDVSYLEGLQQAKSYAKKLGLWFAYSTNGHEICFCDLKAGTDTQVSAFHSPDQLWQLYLMHSGLNPTPQNLSALTENYYDESNIGQRRAPRYYQERSVRAALEAIGNGQRRILICQATGTGKTFCSMQLVYKMFKTGTVKRILFIVDRNLLADQAFNDFNSAMPKDACYRINPGSEPINQARSIYFGIYQSLVGQDDDGNQTGRPDRYAEFPRDFFDLIVIDEAHRGGANQEGSWFRLLEYFEPAIQVGLTATPKNEESNNTYRYFGMPVVNYSLAEGIQDGFLSPYIIKRVMSNIDALGYRPEHSGVRDIRGRLLEAKDYFTPDFEKELSIPARTRAYAYKLLEHLFTTDPLGKTIVFCLNQEHAADMALYVNEAFLKYKERHSLTYQGQYAVRITSNDREANGKYPYLEKFADVESYEPIVVTTSKLLTTGIDVRTIKNIVLFRNIGSMVEFKQIIGRGTRIYDHPDKEREKLGFFILEFASLSTRLFDDPDWDGEPVFIHDVPPVVVPTEPEGSQAGDGDGEGADANEQEGLGPGVVDLPPDAEERMRYRMSPEFLRGEIRMVAQSEQFIDDEGRPMPPEKYIIYKAEVFKNKFPSFEQFQSYWRDNSYRRNFLEKEAPEMGLNIGALNRLFFEKHKVRDVDTLDVLANLFYGTSYLTKEERIKRAQQFDSSFFQNQSSEAKAIIDDLLSVYKEMEFDPFLISSEIWQTPNLKRHGTITEIQNKVGGNEKLRAIVEGLPKALYAEEQVA